jgi:outer membrane receptor protein involved in Fe transport
MRTASSAVFLGILLATAPVSAQAQGSVRGSVIDRTTGAPLNNVLVRLQGTSFSARTDDRGMFAFEAVPSGVYSVVTSLIGYAPATPISVRLAPGATARVDISLRPSAVELSRVVVTATKTPVEERDVPAAVEVVDSAALTASGAKTVMEALRSVAGVTPAAYGENFQSIQLRGLPRLGNENETVLLLIDGVPQTDSRNSARLTTMPIGSVDHIEVIKGPNSALYGRTAIGGVINLITLDPPSKPDFSGRVETGAWGYVRVNALAGAPTDSSGSGYVVSWQGEQRSSFYDQSYKRHESSIFGKLVQNVGARTQLFVTANYASSLGGTPAPIPIVNGKPLSSVDPSFSRFTNLNLPSAAYNQDEVRVTGKLGRVLTASSRLDNTFGFRHTKYDFENDGDLLNPPSAGSDTVVDFPFSEVQEENYYFDDLRFTGEVGPASFHQHVLVGASWEENAGSNPGVLIYTDTNTFGIPISYRNPQYPPLNQTLTFPFGGARYTGDFYGLYIQDEVSLAGRWHLTLGARYDLNHLHTLLPATPTDTTIRASFHKVSPKVGLSYRVLPGDRAGAPELSVYAQYSRAFLPPRAPSDFTSALQVKLFPETIHNVEAGLKGIIAHGRLGIQVAAFNMLRDGIPIEIRNGALFVEANAGQQKFTGVEIGAEARPAALWSVYGKYAFYNGRYGTYRFVQDTTTIDRTGNRVALSPKHQADAGITYGGVNGFGIEVEEHFKSDRFLDSGNLTLLTSYAITDGRVSYSWRKYTWALQVTNLFDAKYETDGDIDSGGFVFPGAPRRLVVELGAGL